jgi:Tol biopolymer transport system component
MNQDGTTQTRTTNDPGVDINPAFSRDGAQLVFATGRGGGLNLELYTINIDGSDPTRLTNHSAVDVLPHW